MKIHPQLPRKEANIFAIEASHGGDNEGLPGGIVTPIVEVIRARDEKREHLENFRAALGDEEYDHFMALMAKSIDIHTELMCDAFLEQVSDPTVRQESELLTYLEWFYGNEIMRKVARRYHADPKKVQQIALSMPQSVVDLMNGGATPNVVREEVRPSRTIGMQVVGNVIYPSFGSDKV